MTDLDALKRRNPIAEVIGAHGVELRAHGRRLTGRCPFHDDRRPSLVVYPATQSFYCFGCGAAGDVIEFLRRAEGLDFREALTRLDGVRAGPAMDRPAQRALTVDDRVILAAACELYQEALERSPEALAYLERRGVSRSVATRFRLGYSDGSVLASYLKRRRLSVARARQLGLLGRGDREAMAGRLVVPELRAGRCVWMVGRSLEDREPRYRAVALPRPLLGWQLVRDQARIFVTEGPFDWLTLAGWGLPACALLGSQPGATVTRLLARARSVVLVLDSDDAGREAARRLAADLGGRAVILALPDAIKDPGELGARTGGREAFFQLLTDVSGGNDVETT